MSVALMTRLVIVSTNERTVSASKKDSKSRTPNFSQSVSINVSR